MKIYLLNEIPFEGVENLILNEIIFYDFIVDLNEYDALIYTSKNALKALCHIKITLNFDLCLYTVGEKSAHFAKNLGFQKVKFAQKSCAMGLFAEFKEELKSKKCLYLRAKNIINDLGMNLKKTGVDVEEKIVYENVFKKSDKTLIHPAIFIFTSPLSVENFLKFYTLSTQDKVVAIGESTAKKLLNFKNLFICEKQSLKACVKLAKNLL